MQNRLLKINTAIEFLKRRAVPAVFSRRCLIALFILLLATVKPVLGQSPSGTKQGTLKWGADTQSNVPYSFSDPSAPTKIIGFEVDIINAIARELGLQPEFIKNDWDGLISGLNVGLYDVVICGVEITDEHNQAVAMSEPYYQTCSQLVVGKDDNEIKCLADCRGKKVGTIMHCGAARLLKAEAGVDVRLYKEEMNAFNDLVNGRLSAVLLDAPIVRYYAGNNQSLKIVGQPIGVLKYGIALNKTNTVLLAKINDAIKSIKAKHELQRILESWNLANQLNTEDGSSVRKVHSRPKKYEKYLAAISGKVSWRTRLIRFWDARGILLRAAVTTIEISILSMILAVLFGFFLAVLRVYAHPVIARIAVLYIEIVRGTPLLIQLLFIFYGLPSLGVKLPPMLAGFLGLGMNYAAYEAENYRAGLLAVPRSQMEAAMALAMTKWQGLRYIIIPQAVRFVLPPVTNDFISLLKDSSLVSMITIVELTGAYNELATTYYDYFGFGLLIAGIYVLLGLPFVRLARWSEKRLAVEKRTIRRNAPQ